MEKNIRNSVKAIIIKDKKILLTKNRDEFGIFYLLPGGGQEHKENMIEALNRECQEEISSKVKVKNLLFIREYIGKNHEFAEFDYNIHQIEYMFECEVIDYKNIGVGLTPDSMQIGVEWIEIDKLKDIRIYPKELKKYITSKEIINDKIYLGDVN